MAETEKEIITEEQGVTSADYYFDSYAHFGIHEEMLKDKVRTNAYRNAILRNPHLFKDKIVLDVGCGTSILSMFAATAGAKHVYGIECSNIIHQARKIVEENNLQDKITLIQGKVEEVTLPVEKVDIIISEWMGYFLLFESMLDTVIFARDKWLVEGGLIFPDKVTLFISGLEDGEYRSAKLDYWNNVYGFKMSCIKDLAKMEPLVEGVDRESIVTNDCIILNVDIHKVKKEDLDFESDFTLKISRNDYLHGFVCYFDTIFSDCHKPFSFSTSPNACETHWKQTIFYINKTLTVNKGEKITGHISCKRNEKNPRDLDINISYNFVGKNSKASEELFYILR